jgi:hypothetical protein
VGDNQDCGAIFGKRLKNHSMEGFEMASVISSKTNTPVRLHSTGGCRPERGGKKEEIKWP